MKLETAERLLRKNYERALSLKWAHLPIAWALYQTWKQVEPKEDESVSIKRAKLKNPELMFLSEKQIRRCRKCKWHDEFSGVCRNRNGLNPADFANQSYVCERWEKG